MTSQEWHKVVGRDDFHGNTVLHTSTCRANEPAAQGKLERRGDSPRPHLIVENGSDRF